MALLLEAMDPLAPPRMVSPRREKKPRFSAGFSAVVCGTVGFTVREIVTFPLFHCSRTPSTVSVLE